MGPGNYSDRRLRGPVHAGNHVYDLLDRLEVFEADTAEEDWLSERAAADLGVGAFGPGVGEAWSTVDFCARELVYGTADRRAIAASDIAAMRQGALFGASPRSERSAPPAKARPTRMLSSSRNSPVV